jgi:tetratricopeptide (TPR) repeat protein
VVALDAAAKAAALSPDEIQMGKFLLLAGAPDDRRRGLTLLARHAQARDLGGRLALRILLADSVHEKDAASVAKWADALRLHPFCTLEDLHACLLACSRADPAHFTPLLSAVKTKLAPSQLRSAELLGWLSQMGRIREAAEWARSVRSVDVDCPPLFIAVAEALRAAALWPELEQWTRLGQWGPGVGLLRQAYRAEALAQLGDRDSAETVLRQVGNQAEGRAAESFLAAQLLYSWGRSEQAVELLWRISRDPRQGTAALGMLVRHYQTRRDATGLYRAFDAWHRLDPEDPMIATACAFFGSVSGLGSPAECERLAARVVAGDPGNRPARCSLAVALTMEGEAPQALEVLRTVAADWGRSPAVAYAYGLALATAGRQAEARPILGSIDPGALTLRQIELSARALQP